jgi:tetratricopeptide (TPR) repeat protein
VLELALKKAPDYADAWAMLALLCGQAHAQRFDPDVDFLSKCVTAARRAVEAAPANHMTHFSLAQALYFQREFESFRNSALRAVELNPMDGNAIAFMGELLSYSGDLERGKELARAAKELNPNHPGWYWITDFYHFYLRQDYRGALSCALKVELPEHWGTYLAGSVLNIPPTLSMA